MHLAAATSFLLQNFAFLAFVAFQAKKQELQVFFYSKKLSSVNMLLSGWAEHVATPGPWHRILCLLWDGRWGRNTLLSAHHIPPLRCTGLREGVGGGETLGQLWIWLKNLCFFYQDTIPCNMTKTDSVKIDISHTYYDICQLDISMYLHSYKI